MTIALITDAQSSKPINPNVPSSWVHGSTTIHTRSTSPLLALLSNRISIAKCTADPTPITSSTAGNPSTVSSPGLYDCGFDQVQRARVSGEDERENSDVRGGLAWEEPMGVVDLSDVVIGATCRHSDDQRISALYI
ncbi:hypothetical protein Ccrd_009688 [Cynara cardunculus var. scolymus]|uniref:Uncharacterized protein n=1 Tax=Cynara cardunculus var. scolymus TaxID=59895 RepID=A0A118K799_CYNCS|nr:hypothetical protein Ccrd_009688 [Cynara cardunculus var. scolymus]